MPRSRFIVLFAGLLALPSVAAPAEFRLPRDIAPRAQAMRLRLDPDRRAYSGSVRVELRIERASDSLCFHADGQRLTSIVVRQAERTVETTRRSGEDGLQVLHLAQPLRPGSATLEIEFTHLYGTRSVGLYRSVREGRGYLFSQFESNDARKAFPCWDEPGFKIPWDVTLEVPRAMVAVSNSPPASETAGDSTRTIVFATTPPLPSYLVAIAVGPFEITPVPGTPMRTQIVTTQGQSTLAAKAIETTPRLLSALERWFGTSYPFEKLDLIAVPEFAYGAMENAGAITYRDDVLLLDPATVTPAQLRSHFSTHAHEMAHMWFGDLVTMAWWDDLWLNESFADWMASKITDEVYPEYGYGISNHQRMLGVRASDLAPSTRAIRDSNATGDNGLVNVGLVYSKGSAVLGMFESYLGADVFQRGVRDYLRDHARGNATADDLWRALDHASGRPVSAAMRTFTDQPGLPHVRMTPVAGGLRVTQSRASTWGVSQPAKRWTIPIVFRWSDGHVVRTERLLLDREEAIVKLPTKPVWVMPNADGQGWYVWSLPPKLLLALGSARASLTRMERVEFVGNLGSLLAMGEVHGDTYLQTLEPFASDPEPQVLMGLLAGLESVRAAFVPDARRAAFAPWVRHTLQPALDRVGLERQRDEPEMASQLRANLIEWLARNGRDERVRSFAAAAALRYLVDSTSIESAIADAALPVAAADGDAALYDQLWARFQAAKVPAMRRRWLGTLGAFEDTTLENRALEATLDPAVKSSEAFLLLMGWRDKSEASRERQRAWMIRHYAEFSAKVPPPSLRFMPLTLGGGCSRERYEAAQAFFSEPEHAAPGIEQTLERVRDGVDNCVSLREREGPAVQRYLESFGAK